MGISAAHCQGIVREFQSVWRVVTLNLTGVCCMLQWIADRRVQNVF